MHFMHLLCAWEALQRNTNELNVCLVNVCGLMVDNK